MMEIVAHAEGRIALAHWITPPCNSGALVDGVFVLIIE
jgi:hypothetical protein